MDINSRFSFQHRNCHFLTIFEYVLTRMNNKSANWLSADNFLYLISIIRTNIRRWCTLEAGRQLQSFVLIALTINVKANKCDFSCNFIIG